MITVYKVVVKKLLTPLFFLVGCAVPTPQDWPLVVDEGFRSVQSLEFFTFSDPAIWSWADDYGGMMCFVEGSKFKPPVRSPRTYGLLKDVEFDAFVLEAEVRQIGRDYGHRDLCFFFGFQSPSQYGYVHLATKPDQRAHNIFLVNEAARVARAPVPKEGISWGNVWHKVRLERLTSGGALQVFFDGELVREAPGEGFGKGQLGFGSFDDTGCIRRLRVWAPN